VVARLVASSLLFSWRIWVSDLTLGTVIGAKLARPLFQALFFVVVPWIAGGARLGQYALVGNLFFAAIFSAVVVSSMHVQFEKWSGTLPLLAVTPAGAIPQLLGRPVITSIESLSASVITIVVLAPWLDPFPGAARIAGAIVALLAGLASANALGLLISASTLTSRWGPLVSNQLAYLLMIGTGVVVPTAIFPDRIQPLLAWLPTAHALGAFRMVLANGTARDLAPALLAELAVAALCLTAALGAFAWRLHRSRAGATWTLT
jgi:ABC-2 type transport system permease protein